MTGGQVRILSLWAFIMVDPADGSEGVPAFPGPGGVLIPLMGADLARVASMRPIAEQAARRMGVPVTLAHFSVRTDQEVIEP